MKGTLIRDERLRFAGEEAPRCGLGCISAYLEPQLRLLSNITPHAVLYSGSFRNGVRTKGSLLQDGLTGI